MVYRVEHRTGDSGPYFRSDSLVLSPAEEDLRREVIASHWDDAHPHPVADGLKGIQGDEYCCFSSLESLGKWFSDQSLDLLHRAGFGVFPYEVDEKFVREGGRQALFFREQAVRLVELKDVR